jgi:glycosyltransferase involved in cell wall biosynthesis
VTHLSEYTLLVVGRRVVTGGSTYYLHDQQWSFLSELAAPFDEVVYLSYEQPLEGNMDGLHPIDQARVTVRTNNIWATDSSITRRLTSLRRDRQNVKDLDGPILSYTFFPGVYSFLMAPTVLGCGEVNAAYFGNEAVDAATGDKSGPIYGPVRKWLYALGQRYVLREADIAFIRDSRMTSFGSSVQVVESKPISKFDAVDIAVDWSTELGDPVELLFVASFRDVKGHEYLLRAFSELVETEDRQYRLRLVGDGETREVMEQLATDLKIRDKVVFTGFIDDKDDLLEQYRRSDIFVLPSVSEGFPRVLDEAMAIGLPVVATRVGGVPAALDHRETALLVDPADPDGLAGAVRDVVNDPALRETLIQNGRKRVEDLFVGSPAEQHLAVLNEAIRNAAEKTGSLWTDTATCPLLLIR